MAENVKVIVRCRPKSKNEMEMKSKSIVKIDKCSVTLENPADLQAPDKSFVYDSAYDSNTATETIYNDICYSLVENVLEGYNGTIFAYGQTGCGKSYTMQGPEELLKNPPKNDPILAHRGIISRSFDHIFEAISVVSGVQYLAMVSYLEIYNENIRDLLNPLTPTSSLSLKEIPGEGIIIQNLSTQTVHNAQECENLLNLGNNNRIVGATLMNAASSRSHSIFTISLEQIAIDNNNNDCQSAGASIKKGKLNLVDLAGSERQNKTGATGDRLKEATKINLSLSALGNVISALVDGKTKHIPYRDSKLTRLLQDSLGGNTKTLMIACISPVEYNYDETLSTLRYASRAKNIHNKPKINEDPKDTILREYQEEILRLKEQLANSTKLNGIHQLNDHPVQNHQQMAINNESFELEKEKLRREYEAETFRLKLEHDAQREQKDELVKDMENLREHYEEQLKTLQESISQNIKNNNNNNCTEDVVNKMKIIKDSLIGGERADDIQFKEKRIRRKIAAENRMSDLTNALNRIEQSADRDLLQGHYSSIQQELQAKTDALKSQRQKVRALEREISDLQSEFQLDRTDYLETIRRLEKNLKFYQQLMDKTLPLLRKEGRFWDVDSIKQQSDWNDDLNKWKLPEDLITSRMKLPPAVDPLRYHVGRQNTLSSTAPGRLERSTSIQLSQSSSSPTSLSSSQSNISIPSLENIQQEERIISAEDDYFLRKKLDHHSDNEDIVENYFKPRRTVELIQESKLLNHKDFKNNNNYHSALLNKRKDIWPKTSIITSTLSWYNNIAAGHNNNTSNNNWDGQRNIKTSMDARDRSSVYDWNNIIKTATNNENKLLTKKIIPPRPQAATPAARINRQPSST